MTSEIDMERAYTTRTMARDAVGKPPSQYMYVCMYKSLLKY
jgi:hypothetical protein